MTRAEYRDSKRKAILKLAFHHIQSMLDELATTYSLKDVAETNVFNGMWVAETDSETQEWNRVVIKGDTGTVFGTGETPLGSLMKLKKQNSWLKFVLN